MKTCTKCKQELPLDRFSKHGRKSDGLQVYCKSCQAVDRAAYRAAHHEKERAWARAYRAANREEERVRCRAYRAANREKTKEYQAAYRAAHLEKAKEHRVASHEKELAQQAASRNELKDSYVSRLICKGSNLKASQITPELIKKKRQAMEYRRMSRQIKQLINPKEKQK